MAQLFVAADLCPIGDNLPFLLQPGGHSLFNDLLPPMGEAGAVVANLECPLVDSPSPIQKTGPVFSAPERCAEAISRAGINILCLANNHIMDQGPDGLRATLEACAKAGIATVGAGKDLASARRMLLRRIGGIRLGILAVAEHEFSIAARNSWGANPLDLIDFVRNVNENRGEFDYLLVLLHGSAEFHAPTPRIQNTCRFMIEMGANAVIVQHPHFLGGIETYRGGHIVYGQGALLMDEAIYRDLKSFHEGFLVNLNISAGASSTIELIPFVQSDPPPGARRMAPEREKEFRLRLDERSRAISDPDFVEKEWIQFCDERKHGYMSALLGHNRILRKLNQRGSITKLLHGRPALLGTRNCVSCETHREAIETIFNQGLI